MGEALGIVFVAIVGFVFLCFVVHILCRIAGKAWARSWFEVFKR